MDKRVELTFHQAYGKAVEVAAKYPHLLPITLQLHPDGLWTFQLVDTSQDGGKDFSSFMMEVILNPDKE